MRKIDRYNVVTKIALHLQQTMTTSKINVFLGGFGVEHDCVSIVDSKRSYVLRLLSDVNARLVSRIATELGIEAPNAASQTAHELVDYLEKGGLAAAHDDFGRAMDSIDSDPAQAIASSCSTLESICKAILDACDEPLTRVFNLSSKLFAEFLICLLKARPILTSSESWVGCRIPRSGSLFSAQNSALHTDVVLRNFNTASVPDMQGLQ